jgi:hypothetical protein
MIWFLATESKKEKLCKEMLLQVTQYLHKKKIDSSLILQSRDSNKNKMMVDSGGQPALTAKCVPYDRGQKK